MYRYLCFITPTYKNEKYITAKKIYNDNLYQMHKRFIKSKTKISADLGFEIRLIGFDGKCKKRYNKLDVKRLFDDIEKMPMGHLRSGEKGLSLYADYNPKSTIKGTGFKDAETAKRTISLIKNKDIGYQRRVIQTMLNRAKFHPHQTDGMKKAIKIFEKWIKDHKK